MVSKAGVASVPQGRRVFAPLTVEENLEIALRKGGEWTVERVYDMMPRLRERRTNLGSQLSGGEQQMLAIGRALMAGPKLLLLDEPSLGLAPRIIEQIGSIVQEINRQGTSVLLVEQNATIALSVADLAFVLDVGKVSLSGEAAELAKTDAVQRLYLGHAAGEEDAVQQAAARSTKTLSRWTA